MVSTLAHNVLVLFAMVNALGNIPVFADLTADLDKDTKRKVFNIAVLTGGSIVLGFAFMGRWMLESFFQVSADAFRVAGGILVFMVAARNMIGGNPARHMVSPSSRDSIGIFPIGFPFLAGPGTIVTTILLMQHTGALITAVAAVIVYLTVLPILYLTGVIPRVLGRVGILVVARVLYIFICAKAVAFVIAGVKGAFQAAG